VNVFQAGLGNFRGYAPRRLRIQPRPQYVTLQGDSADLIYGQWSILGTRASSLQDVVEVVRLVENRQLKPVVSRSFPVEGAVGVP